MADENKRQPVPAGGAPNAAALENADATPPQADAPNDAPKAEPADESELVEARVLIAHGNLEPNDLHRAPAAEIERLKLAGVVDDHEDAVAYVKAA